MRRVRIGLALAIIAALAIAAPTNAATVGAAADGRVKGAGVDRGYAIVQLHAAPLATSARTRPAGGRRIDFNSSAVRSYRAELAALRNQYKSWLRQNAPNARVTREFDISLNAVAVRLNGHTLRQVSATSLVRQAQYQGRYYPIAHEDPDLAIIDALDAWTQGGGPATAGAGVKVAIVDSGIDHTHPCFSDAGYPSQTQLGDTRFTNNKVIVAKVFYNKAAVRNLTPEAVDSHGTHVAGTVACNYHTPATVNGVDIPYEMSGVAPRALLGNYNVFPGTVDWARSEDILNALEAAYADGMHVANMSLGGGAAGRQDLLTIATNNLDLANMVVAVAAGNEGPGRFTVQSPGSAARALTAGASSVNHFVGAPVTVAAKGTLPRRSFGAASGDFETVEEDLTAPLAVVTTAPTNAITGLSTACSALPANSLTGRIALISRGVCTFSTKIRNAQNAGAVAVLVVNNVAGDPVAMATDETPNQPTVPAYQVGVQSGLAMKAYDGAATTISADQSYFLTDNVNIMAGFSSQGPTDVTFGVKPDVVAPGVNVLSSVPANACDDPPCFAFFQGTSMATPHLAGSAAVVRGQHPTWTAAQVRSAIVNTAVRGVLKHYLYGLPIPGTDPVRTYGFVNDVQVTGAGLENLANAVNAQVALDPVSVTFGAVPWGSGQARSVAVRLTNLSGATADWSLSISGTTGTGVTFSVSPTTLDDVPAGATRTVIVTMRASKGAAIGERQAWLEVSSGGTNVAHAALYTFVK